MTGGKPSQATLLVELAEDMVLFHTPEGEAFARIEVDGHRETWRLGTKATRNYLSRRFYEAHRQAPNAQALQDALGVLGGRASFEGPEAPVHTRVAEHEGAIYLDLADKAWGAVEITPEGWSVVDEPPVRFRRARGMLALPAPQPDGSIEDLRTFLNLAGEPDLTLVIAWLTNALRPIGPYPVLVLHGEQGSAKSTTARICRGLIDPNSAGLRAEPRDARDLMIAASNGWVVALDNLSHLPPWFSDALCRLATGGGFATRELYSDAEETIFAAQRPTILNGIEELATRGDLLDRSLVVYLPAIPGNRRQAERTFWRRFEVAHPRLLGGLLDVVSRALTDVDDVELDSLPRMADFAEWVTAASPALGWSPDRFLAAYTGNRREANEITLDASIIYPPLAKVGAFEGTAGELLAALAEHVEDDVTRRREWPKSPRALGGQLRRIAPNLRRVGIDIEFDQETTGKRRRLVRISAHSTVSSVSSVSPGHEEGAVETVGTQIRLPIPINLNGSMQR